jgi:Domain of unknown function (DUF4400)
MIIRVVSTISLILLLILVLYLPSAHPPEHFISQLSIEHERNSAFWGEEHALRILSRMLELHTDAKQASPIPVTLASSEPRNQVDSAAASQMSQMSTRLFNNQYFQSIGALFALATYRFSAFVEWLPYLSIFVLAAFLDGFIRRIIKSKEFLQHNPELFALHASLVILVACGTVVTFVLPVTVNPLLLALVPASVGIFGSLAIANYHHRG